MTISIRAACAADEEALALLAYKTYFRRYFDRQAKGPDGAELAKLSDDFPELEKGQNLQSFQDYWAEFIPNMGNPDPYERSYCFVAVEEETQEIIGFIKGDGAAYADKTCELGSVYILIGRQRGDLGTELVQTYAAAMQNLGYEQMVTRCWEKNDSPRFFNKLGAAFAERCDIPIGYYDAAGKAANTVIPGILLAWNADSFRKLSLAA